MEHAKPERGIVSPNCMAKNGSALAELFSWPGDVSSLIREMKRHAGCEFDRDLADFLGRGHTAVSQWRRRGTVPEAVLLRFEARLRAD